VRQPDLVIVAGCNGSGKSTYSKFLVEDGIIPFDYDLRFKFHYESLPDSEFREQFAKNKTTIELESSIEFSFKNQKTFCFETNLLDFPINWVDRAKNLGFRIVIFFFCLESIALAKRRVLIRTKNNGHFVENDVIESKWKAGYKNINLYYQLADLVVFIDNTKEDSPTVLFELVKESDFRFVIEKHVEEIPDYTERRLPSIFRLLQ